MKWSENPMKIADRVLDIYGGLDGIIAHFRAATGMRCPEGCSYCCRNWTVETTVVEVLPLGLEIYARREEETVLSSIDDKETCGDSVCAVLLPNSLQGDKGSCGYYEWRPLICRLFGYAVRRNKWEETELCTCRIIREKEPSSVRRAEIALREGLGLPVYQETFMQIASLDPAAAYRMLPINRAIKEALEHIYWIRSRGKGWKKASGY
jgi:Fe-S-cluster containining protein